MPQARTRKGIPAKRDQTGIGSRSGQFGHGDSASGQSRADGRQGQSASGRGQHMQQTRQHERAAPYEPQAGSAVGRGPGLYLNAGDRQHTAAGSAREYSGSDRKEGVGRGAAARLESEARSGAEYRAAAKPEASRHAISVRPAGPKRGGSGAGKKRESGGGAGGGQLIFDESSSRNMGSQVPPQEAEQGREPAWKAVVRQYIKLCNQAEIDRSAPWFDGIVSDEDHLQRYYNRLERLRECELLRGVLPVRSQTGAELLRVSVSESLAEASAMAQQRITRTIRQNGRTYTEERLESERLWLAAEGDSFRIVRIEPVVAERRPRYGMPAAQAPELSDPSPDEGTNDISQSQPYINDAILPNFKYGRAGIRYRRDLAAAYADRWWNEPNPAYETFEVNCTNYVSQCLFAGHAPMNYTGKRESGWWYRGRSGGREMWSYSWAVAGALQLYLSAPRQSGLRATVVDSADQLELGDVIIYDWSGDNRFQHSTIVTAFDAGGMPLVNANTVPSRHRYWDYTDSYAWTEQTKYRFFHIADEF